MSRLRPATHNSHPFHLAHSSQPAAKREGAGEHQGAIIKNGWKVKTLGEICEIERGGSPRPIDSFLTNEPDGINWIKIGGTKNVTKYITTTEEKIRPEGAKRSRMVYEGDFILSNSMSFGRPYIMKTTGCIHDGWLVLRQQSGGSLPKVRRL